MSDFAAKIEAWVNAVPGLLEAVVQDAAQEFASIMQTPGPSVANPGGGAGGNMPIRDGFLRASLVITYANTLPGPTFKPSDGVSYTYNAGEIDLAIVGASIPGRINLTYAANYSAIMEARYGFARLAMQKWPTIFAASVDKVRARNSGG